MRLFGFHIFKQKAGVISERGCWVCFYKCWMHTAETLLSLVWNVVTEFKSDRHLVG